MRFVVINAINRLPVRTEKIIRFLKRRGQEVKLIMWGRSCSEFDNYSNLVDNYSVFRTQNITVFLLRAFIVTIKVRPDYVFCSDIRMLPLAIFIRFFCNSSVYYDNKEFPASTFAIRMKNTFKVSERYSMVIFEIMEGLMLRMVQGIISIPIIFSRHSYIPKHPNFSIVINAPSIETDIPLPKDIEQFKDKYRGKILLIYAGTISVDKGFDKYLRLIRRLSIYNTNIQLLLVGFDLLEKGISIPDDIINYVEVLPFIPYQKMLGLLSICSIGLAVFNPLNTKFRFLGSGTSRKILTYMHCGLPVVASRMPLNNMIEEFGAGMLVDYEDEDGLYEACIKLLKCDKMHAKMRRNANKAVHDLFNWEKEERKIEQIFFRQR